VTRFVAKKMDLLAQLEGYLNMFNPREHSQIYRY